jgi:hypothetical protein
MSEDKEYKRMYEHILKDYKQVDRALELSCNYIIFFHDEEDLLTKKEKKEAVIKEIDYFLKQAKDELEQEEGN